MNVSLTQLRWKLRCSHRAAEHWHSTPWIPEMDGKLTSARDSRRERAPRNKRLSPRRNICDWIGQCSSWGSSCDDHDRWHILCTHCNERFSREYTCGNFRSCFCHRLPIPRLSPSVFRRRQQQAVLLDRLASPAQCDRVCWAMTAGMSESEKFFIKISEFLVQLTL